MIDLQSERPLKILNHATLVCQPGQLEGEELERALEARALRAHLMDKDEFRTWQEGGEADPEIEFWRHNDTP